MVDPVCIPSAPQPLSTGAALPPVREEWERRFKARILDRLTQRYGEDPESGWTEEQAKDAARAEFEASDFEELYRGFEMDPEGSADECLSYWGDGV